MNAVQHLQLPGSHLQLQVYKPLISKTRKAKRKDPPVATIAAGYAAGSGFVNGVLEGLRDKARSDVSETINQRVAKRHPRETYGSMCLRVRMTFGKARDHGGGARFYICVGECMRMFGCAIRLSAQLSHSSCDSSQPYSGSWGLEGRPAC
jgi:hypothetical protein